MGKWLPEENGPVDDGDQRPELPACVEAYSDCSLLFVECPTSPRTGELGLLPNGDPGNEAPVVGLRVNKNSFADICQNDLLDVNISAQPSTVFSSGLWPTVESSEVINPIRSSF